MSDVTFLQWPFFDPAHREALKSFEQCASSSVLSSDKEEESEDDSARHYVRSLGEKGSLKFCVPKAYGGVTDKLDVRSLCLGRETFARHSALMDFSFAMQGLGSGPISLFGSDAQKKSYLPYVARGEKIAAFALSESEAGSDVSAIATSAVKEGNEYILNGSKSWISNAGFADFYIVFARTGEQPGAKGLSAFIVDSTVAGFSVSERVRISSPHPVGTLSFKNCRIPESALIGKSGDGFKIAMGTLDVFRSSVGAAALGMARRAFDEACRYAKSRQVFGVALSDQQMIQDKIATMAVQIDASALLIYRAAWYKDTGAERVSREASMAKLFSTESAQQIIDQAVQIFGGSGVVAGSVVERLYRDIRPLRIYEGTSEIQKIVIARHVLKES
jgi:acyl-CoA dehydrogenase